MPHSHSAIRSAISEATLDVVRRYHRGWTTHAFADAAAALADQVTVEVPVNEYPTKDAFMAAVTAFGEMTTRVDLLDELVSGDTAMLLYDMQVVGLGELRVAEHFTVLDGAITRIRQIHDTHPLRLAGFVRA